VTQRMCVLLCEFTTTCYSIAGACFRRLKIKCDGLLSNFAFNSNLRLCNLEDGHYKFPYDLNPATTPSEQWNPLEVGNQ